MDSLKERKTVQPLSGQRLQSYKERRLNLLLHLGLGARQLPRNMVGDYTYTMSGVHLRIFNRRNWRRRLPRKCL